MRESKKDLRLGEVVVNNKGQEMTIVEYKNCCDIAVKFEDGTIIRHAKYKSFKAGTLQNYQVRLNEENVNSLGLKMKIVEYRSASDIDVEFEDGTIVRTKYSTFKNGTIRNPNEHIGEVFKLKDGTTAKLIEYKTIYNVTLELSNGLIVRNVGYRTIKRGSLGRNAQTEGDNLEDKTLTDEIEDNQEDRQEGTNTQDELIDTYLIKLKQNKKTKRAKVKL